MAPLPSRSEPNQVVNPTASARLRARESWQGNGLVAAGGPSEALAY